MATTDAAASLATVVADLAGEHAALDAIVADLHADGWDLPTPSEPWRVRDQIGHLTYYDGMARLALVEPDAFATALETVISDPEAAALEAERLGIEHTGADLLARWRDGRAALLEALRDVEPDGRVAWYGPSMSPRSFVTARLMETWAHGQDVVDALGVHDRRPPTARLRHIAHLGVVTRGWSYGVRGLAAPDGDVYVELAPPGGGEKWTWGDPAAADVVAGPAEDFCLVVTQRRHRADTALRVVGPLAVEWLEVAQAFAGPPTEGPTPGSRVSTS